MKITSFNPLILSPKAEEVIKLFEELGFERRHTPVLPLETGDVVVTRMKDADGNAVDVAEQEQLAQDMMAVRVNVDDFEKAFDMLEKRGIKNTRKDRVIISRTGMAATMVSPSGLTIILVKHLKD